MKSKYFIIGAVILVIIVGIIFIKNPFNQEAEGEGNGQPSSGEIGEPDAKWVFEGLRLSGEMVDIEILELPDGSYAMHIPFANVAYSPDGLTWTMSEDKAIGAGPSILKLSDGGYRAWWSIPTGGENFDMLTSFSSDGYNWEKETMLTSSNMKDFYGTLPCVVLSPDGTYRMYYARSGPETFTISANDISWLELPEELLEVEFPVYRIHSAHSSDGLFWEPDSGVRIDGVGANNGHASSADIYIREDGKYEMVYCSGSGNIGWAVSDDGLSWTHISITDFHGLDPIINVFPDGTIRMYYDNWIGPLEQTTNLPNLPETIDGKPPGIYSAVRESI